MTLIGAADAAGRVVEAGRSGAGAVPGARRPAYAVGAVDHALVALDLLGRRPSLRLTELAAELHIGRATAHRLLQMMVYRGFAVQNRDRSYAAGPALLAAHDGSAGDPDALRDWMRPHLAALGVAVGETVHLTVLVGIEAVCVDSVDGSAPGRVPVVPGSRVPAEAAAGGLALLALLPAEELSRRFAGRPRESMQGLERTLATTRRAGFGMISGASGAGNSSGITSVARAVTAGSRGAVAVGFSAPASRAHRPQIMASASALLAVAEAAVQQRL